MIKKDDYVTRKSYDNDIVFKVLFIINNIAYLQGVDIRLIADSYIDDLIKVEQIRNNDEVESLPIQKGNYLNGKILHLDSDEMYLKRSMKLYEDYKVPSVGYRLDEKDMPVKIVELLNKHHPDILIITGHDAIDKQGNNMNSKYFVECVKNARTYQPNKDSLCIISGACILLLKI